MNVGGGMAGRHMMRVWLRRIEFPGVAKRENALGLEGGEGILGIEA